MFSALDNAAGHAHEMNRFVQRAASADHRCSKNMAEVSMNSRSSGSNPPCASILMLIRQFPGAARALKVPVCFAVEFADYPYVRAD
jgi:hypothetical protein